MKKIFFNFKGTSFLILYTTLIVFFFDFCRSEEFIITPFEEADRIDTIQIGARMILYKTDNYLISGYKDNAEILKKIKQFACQHKDTSFQKYGEYIICFYKKSAKTNNQYIKDNPRELLRYSLSNDFVYEFKWKYFDFLSIRKIEKKGMSTLITDELDCK